jgi:hypothetical protein
LNLLDAIWSDQVRLVIRASPASASPRGLPPADSLR